MVVLSIIIPFFNVEKYISQTIESILASFNLRDYEIILVNDGSTDKSEEIASKYIEENDHIKMISIRNSGVSTARNLGIENASGKYITFIDGDDTINPVFLSKAIRELESGGYDFVQGNFITIRNDQKEYCQRVERDKIITNREDMLRLFLDPRGKIIHNAVWGKVFKADLIHELVFDSCLTISEDQKYVFDIIMKAKVIKLLEIDAINYFVRNTSAMNTLNLKKLRNRLSVLSYMKEKTLVYEDICKCVEYEEYLMLIQMYGLCVNNKNKEEKNIVNQIRAIPYHNIKEFLKSKEKIRFFLLLHFRKVYNGLLLVRHSV